MENSIKIRTNMKTKYMRTTHIQELLKIMECSTMQNSSFAMSKLRRETRVFRDYWVVKPLGKIILELCEEFDKYYPKNTDSYYWRQNVYRNCQYENYKLSEEGV